MIYSFHRIKSVRPDATLDLIGPYDEDPAYYEECRDLIRRLDCPDIRFVGRADVTRWLPGLDLVLLTSISEGQPFVLLEAMAAHRPVVATNVGACREIIEGAGDGLGPAGRVVPVMSPAAIAEGVLDISRSPAQLRALAENGYRRVVRFYQDKDFLAAYRALPGGGTDGKSGGEPSMAGIGFGLKKVFRGSGVFLRWCGGIPWRPSSPRAPWC